MAFKKGSHIWKTVGKGYENLRTSMVWKLGEGTSINLWLDNWLGIGLIRQYMHGPLNKGEEEMKVKDIIIENKWDISQLSFNFPPFIAVRIASMQIPFQIPDTTFSSLVDHDKFSRAEVYNKIIDQRTHLKGSEWIWKVKTLPKLNFFLWLMWWDRLPHNTLLHLRHIIPSPECPTCPEFNEDTLHVIRDCTKASQIWNLIALPGEFWDCNHIARNKFIFGQKAYGPPEVTLNQALNLTKDFIANQSTIPLLKTPQISQKWKNYSRSYVQVNVDASFVDIETIASIAGVIRNHQGNWLTGFQSLSYATNPFHAECLAIRQGLQIAIQKKFAYIGAEALFHGHGARVR
ncbi:uncharacterized protein LOC125492934 [Beta vulgaris subsp. vulgaris]|uniref:uncharacterized protein LOC125492934 n=1 Tax=Beta vulgaris subsp. vulgaris TaxID=3555 RepID=UPI0020368FF5|nr:uncharacterized protein LOC125492934 [Beta vulgaris subsp. vulgaris]